MRIAFFVQYCNPAGTYFRWHNIAISLIKAGNEVDIYAGDTNFRSADRIEIRDGITYYIMGALISAKVFRSPNDPFLAIKRVFNLPKGEYNIYHLFQPFLEAYLPWKYLQKKYRNDKSKKFLYDWDDLWVGGYFKSLPKNIRDKYSYWLVSYLEKKIPLQANITTVCSSFLANRVSHNASVKLLYNGYWAKTSLISKSVCRKKWGLLDNFFYLAYIGKTAGEIDWLKAAIDKLELSPMLQIKLIIAGPPKSLLQSVGLLDHPMVCYFGEVSPDEAFELTKSADLGLIPLENSLFNQSRFPIKFFDFLNAGTPVYYSAVGEIARIAKDTVGAFEAFNTKEEWGNNLQNIVKYLQHNSLTISQKELDKQFSWTAIASLLEEIYHDKSDA